MKISEEITKDELGTIAEMGKHVSSKGFYLEQFVEDGEKYGKVYLCIEK